MSDVTPDLFILVHPSKAKLSWFLDRNFFLIASIVSAFSPGKCCSECWQMVAPTCSVMYYMTDIVLGLLSSFMEYEPKQIQTWGCDSRCLGEVWQFESPLLCVWSVSSVSSVNIEQIYIPNMNFLCELTIVIPRPSCLVNMAKAVSSTVDLVNKVTSDSVNSFNFAMCDCANRCFPIEWVPFSDRWGRTWWQMINMMPGLQVFSMPQCK